MTRRAFPRILFISIVILLIAAAGCINFIPETQPLEQVSDAYYAEMDTVLIPYIQTIDKQMIEITTSVWNAARELDGVPADDPAVYLAILKLKSEIPLSYDVERIDKDNILTAITGESSNHLLIDAEIISNQYTEEEFKAAGEVCIISQYALFQNGERGIKVSAPVMTQTGILTGHCR